jgi:hypothetical protein
MNRGDRDRDIQLTAIFGDAHRLIVRNVLTLANARRDLWNLVRAVGESKWKNSFNDLMGAVPIHFWAPWFQAVMVPSRSC